MKCRKGIALVLAIFFIFSVSGTSTSINSDVSIPASTSAASEKLVIPDGRCIGVALSTNGVLVVDLLDVTSSDGERSSPAKLAGLKAGDLIQEFSGKKISTVNDLTEAISASDGKNSSLKINREGKTAEVLVKPITSQSDGVFKIGAWVKDAVSGIGTLTFYDPQNKSFAALGHGICDPETGGILSVKDGNILSASIVSISKGGKGAPGELNGIFKEDSAVLGIISQNSNVGIYGTITPDFSSGGTPLPLGKRKDVKLGEAKILSTINGSKPQEFDVKIIKIIPKVISYQKGFVIEITDTELIEKTGGIVQGMSGSPIIQEGKIIGAVTHVFVNDPTKGYGIFIEDMISGKEKKMTDQ